MYQKPQNYVHLMTLFAGIYTKEITEKNFKCLKTHSNIISINSKL